MFEETRRHRAVETAKGLLALAGLLLFIAGAGLAVYQAGVWLQAGRWPRLSAADLLLRWGAGGAGSWLVEPRSWYGLHRLVMPLLRLPAALLAAAAGGLFFAFFISNMDKRRRF